MTDSIYEKVIYLGLYVKSSQFLRHISFMMHSAMDGAAMIGCCSVGHHRRRHPIIYPVASLACNSGTGDLLVYQDVAEYQFIHGAIAMSQFLAKLSSYNINLY